MKVWFYVVPIVALSIAGGLYERLSDRPPSEADFVADCSVTLKQRGVSGAQARKACSCMADNAGAARDAGTDVTQAVFERYYDQCMAPVISAYEAQQAWDEDADAAVSGWDDDAGSGSTLNPEEQREWDRITGG